MTPRTRKSSGASNFSAFMSYSHEDSEFALRLAADLEAAGLKLWVDQFGIGPGKYWDRVVPDVLSNCPHMLVLLSPAIYLRENVLDEIDFALEKGNAVIPVLYRDCETPFRLRRLRPIDFRTDYERGLSMLLMMLAKKPPSSRSAGKRRSQSSSGGTSDWVRSEQQDVNYRLAAMEDVHGREEQMAEACGRWLNSPDRRLLIYGSPGIGKSTFARSILRSKAAKNRFKKRRFEIQCDNFSSLENLISQMALQWFGLTEYSAERLRWMLLGRLGQEPTAILLDNFETLMRKGPDVRRESLRWLAQLGGIDCLWMIAAVQGRTPPDGLTWKHRVEPETLSVEAARKIFCEWSNVPAHADDPHLDELLAEVDYVPHCVKLLGGLAQDSSLDLVLEQWKKYRMGVFPKPEDKPLPDESVTVTYQFAIDVLDQPTQADLRVLAWLPSGVAENDVQVVLPSGLQADGKLYRAAVAYRKGTPSRLRMLKPLQDYVARTHPSSIEERQAARDHYLSMAIQGNNLGKRSNNEVLFRLGIEYPNLPPALQDAFAEEGCTAIDAACGIGQFSARTGVGRTESRAYVERARDLAKNLDDSKREAECLVVLGHFDFVGRKFESAKGSYERALQLFRETKEQQGQANCLLQLADASGHQNDIEAAEKLYREAVALFSQLPDRVGKAWCLKGLGNLAYKRKQFDQARKFFENARSSFCEIQHRRGEAGCLWELAELDREGGNLLEAEKLLSTAAEISRQVGDTGSEAWCLKSLGDVAFQQDAHDRAGSNYSRALTTFRDAEEKSGEAECLASLAEIAVKRGGLEEAHRLRIQARDAFLAADDRESAGRVQAILDGQ
jgi:tetratricopeptide (TPR) repeat protein